MLRMIPTPRDGFVGRFPSVAALRAGAPAASNEGATALVGQVRYASNGISWSRATPDSIQPTAWPWRVPDVVSSPPTVTAGVNGAASAISGSVLTPGFAAGAFSWFGGPVPRGINFPDYLGVNPGRWNGTATGDVSQSPTAMEFTFETSDSIGRFEIEITGRGTPYRILMMQSNGNWGAFSAGATRVVPSDGGGYRDLVTLGAAGEYRLRIEFGSNSNAVSGLRATPGSTFRAARSAYQLNLLGDSYSEPTISDAGASFAWDGWPQQLAYLTGYNIFTNAKGGSGYVETLANQSKRFRARLTEVLTYSGDVLFAGGINDVNDDVTSFTTEVAGCFSDVVAAGRRLFVLSPFWPNGIQGYPVYLLQYRDILKAQCEAAGGTFLDVLDTGIPEFLLPYSTWTDTLTAGGAINSTEIRSATKPGYFNIANTGGDNWFIKIGSGAAQQVRQVTYISGSAGDWRFGLSAGLSAAVSNGALLSLAGPGYLTGTGRQNAPAGNGNSDFYTGPDTTHPTKLGHHHIARVVAYLLARAVT